ncbi:type II secretion system protein [Candidatus Saccharibacteria bacterium]|nr:type II secretion system protein [Candidatus Saccharibacteria bacterium]
MNVQKQTKQGFTIIEVVLVLAIAGLIFLMVFIALPALQRSQRDTQRRDDVARVISQINSYQTNNNGRVPSLSQARGDFRRDYLKVDEGEFQDPQSGENYNFSGNDPSGVNMQYVVGSKCNGESLQSGAGSRSVAVRVQLEGSGVFCQDNQ